MITLSPQRFAVLCQVAQGKTNAEVAKALGISKNTVKVYIWAIMRCLNLTSRTQLALYALKHQLISLDEIELPGDDDV